MTLRNTRIFIGVLTLFVSCSFARADSFQRGDSDASGTVDITDGIRVLGFLFLGQPTALDCEDAADADDSGILSITDGILILSYLFTGGDAPPAPFPECGEDPTPDDLSCDAFAACDDVPRTAPPAPSVDATESPTRATEVSLVVRATPDVASVEVKGGAAVVVVTENDAGVFRPTVPLFSRRNHRLYVRAIGSTGLASAPSVVEIVQDDEPPFVFIDDPVDGSVVMDETISLTGRVSDRLSGHDGLTVSVDGVAAAVSIGIGTNGTFELAGVTLDPGMNRFTVVARDAAGNTSSRETTVDYQPIDEAASRIEVVSGGGQEAMSHSLLADPIVVRAIDGDGSPLAGQVIDFLVTKSDGRIGASRAAALEGRSLSFSTPTDDQGLATVYWKLGADAGRGNNRLIVKSENLVGFATICASALPSLPVQINVGSGDGQRVEAGTQAPLPLRAWVSDTCNGVPGIDVTFEVVKGTGTLDGGSQATVTTGATGHASVEFIVGPERGNQVVRASFDGNPTSVATFTTFAVTRTETGDTHFAGVVTDNASRPIGGAVCELRFQGEDPLQATTRRDGRFRISKIPHSGLASFEVLGTTAQSVGDGPIDGMGFPNLEFDVVIVEGADNGLGRTIVLPVLEAENFESYSTTTDTLLTVDGIDGLEMRVFAGSMTLRGGVPAPEGTSIGLSQVHHDDIPMPMPDGAAPPFAWTLQPAGATFDPPIQISYPNMSGLPAGAVAYFLTFDHDTQKFEIVSSGTVSADGSTIVSDPGAGLSLSGWGCNCPPYAVTGDCEQCDPPVNGCGPQDSALNNLPIDIFPDCSLEVFGESDGIGCDTCFTPACDGHDRCYGTCGTTQAQCDQDMVASAWSQCDCVEDPEVKALCQRNSLIYGDIVEHGGAGPFQAGQEAACECEDRQGGGPGGGAVVGGDGGGAGVFAPERDWVDEDRDFAPDDWEEEVGLDPTNPDDALLDFDDDGLVNLVEMFHGTDPFLPDTDGDGFSDAENAAVIQPEIRRLDASWTMSVGAQSVNVDPDGRFRIANISAPDAFGAEGPGSLPDFTSDDFTRVIGVRQTDEGTLWAWSEPFKLVGGETFFLGDLTIDVVPPPVPLEIDLRAEQVVISAGETLQLETRATLTDGTFADFTAGSSGTSYRSSNADFATVGPDGLLTARADGPVFVTAVCEGATSVLRVLIESGKTRDVVVEGRLVFPDGEPTEGGTVTSTLGPGVKVGPDGSFSIALIVPLGQTPVLRFFVTRDGINYSAIVQVEGDLSSGLVRLGEVTLEAIQSSLNFDARRDFTLDVRAHHLELADLDLDGSADVVIAEEFSSRIQVLLGDAESLLLDGQTYALDEAAQDIALGDLDGDDYPDLVVYERIPDGLSIWINDGNGGFVESANTYDEPDFLEGIELVDIDGDGALDLVVVGAGSLRIRLGLGDGTFEDTEALVDVPFGDAAAFGDFDGDEQLDIVLNQPFGNAMTLVTRLPDGGFADFEHVQLGLNTDTARTLLASDIDEDGMLDVVIGHVGGMSWLKGSGGGAFLASVSLVEGSEVSDIVAEDFDQDGTLDLVAYQPGVETLLSFRGSGEGNFEAPGRIGLSTFNGDIEVADARGDGLPDLFVSGDRFLSVLESGPSGLRFAHELALESDPYDLVVADFDGDGVQDLVVAGESVFPEKMPGARVLLSRPNRTFVLADEVSINPRVRAADIDLDGIIDLLTITSIGSVQVHEGNGDGTFVPGEVLSFPGVIGSDVAVADLNGDGLGDLILVALVNGEVAVRLALPEGGYAPQTKYAAGTFSRDLDVVDVDNDGRLDLVLIVQFGGRFAILLGRGDGSFDEPVEVSVLGAPESVAIGDLNGDSVPDAAIASSNNGLQLLFGQGDGTFTDAPIPPILPQVGAAAVKIVDLDGDANMDLIVGYDGLNSISVFRGTGENELEAPLHFGGPTSQFAGTTVAIEVADLDDDGRLDIILAGDSSVAVFYAR